MKYQTTPAFNRDFKRRPRHHQDKFRELIPRLDTAAQRAAAGKDKPWPKGMRIKPIQGAPGIWELTWSMKDPDGRATWEWVQVEGQVAIRWRRVGDHAVLDNA